MLNRICCHGLVLLLLSGMFVQPSFAGEPMAADESAKLHAIFEAAWKQYLADEPTEASQLGVHEYDAFWPDVSLGAIEKRHNRDLAFLGQLDQIERAKLNRTDRISYELFRQGLEFSIAGYRFRGYLLPINQRGGLQDAGNLADALRFEKKSDYEAWLERMANFPTYADQTIALMREGMRRGIVHAEVVMKRVPRQVEAQIVDDPAESMFYQPFERFPKSFATETQERLRQNASRLILKRINPAYERLLAFLQQEYLPACHDEVGFWQMPDGKEFYAFEARRFTTTDLTPGEIHEIGLREVARIRGEMEQIVEEVEWQGTFREFLDHLRTDPKFYYEDSQQLLEGYRSLCKRIDPQLVKLFGRLPRMPYGVEPIPEAMAPDTTTAYYRQPAADGSRAGTYFVNLYKPETRPKYEMEVLSAHEAVPGHHLQIALAMEMEGLPEFRRYSSYTSYVEGWALYSEGLGEELGLYEDPYSKFGQLTYEMWRAVRLVVDTGIHEKRWPRQQAIDFFAANTPKPILDIENEVDRYIAWPGQALAYKIGELKIKELRARAEAELGNRFDIRAFHDTILAEGAVTLDILESQIDNWIAEQKQDG